MALSPEARAVEAVLIVAVEPVPAGPAGRAARAAGRADRPAVRRAGRVVPDRGPGLRGGPDRRRLPHPDPSRPGPLRRAVRQRGCVVAAVGRRPRDPGHRGLQAAGVPGPDRRPPRGQRRRGGPPARAPGLHRRRRSGGRARARPSSTPPPTPSWSGSGSTGSTSCRRSRTCFRGPRPWPSWRSRCARSAMADRAAGTAVHRATGCRRSWPGSGVGSRRVCEELIVDGRVTVNGEVPVLGRRVDPAVDRVELDGVPLPVQPGLVHYLVNKPAGVVSTAEDTHGRPTVVSLVPDEPRVFPVGPPGHGLRGPAHPHQRRRADPPAHPPLVRGAQGVPGPGGGGAHRRSRSAGSARASTSTTGRRRRPGWRWWPRPCCAWSSTRDATGRSGGCARPSAIRWSAWSGPASGRSPTRRWARGPTGP